MRLSLALRPPAGPRPSRSFLCTVVTHCTRVRPRHTVMTFNINIVQMLLLLVKNEQYSCISVYEKQDEIANSLQKSAVVMNIGNTVNGHVCWDGLHHYLRRGGNRTIYSFPKGKKYLEMITWNKSEVTFKSLSTTSAWFEKILWWF